MRALHLLFRDIDRLPYLHMLRDSAARRGLRIELRQAPPGPRFAESLLDGEVDLLAENYWSLQSLAATGIPIVAVASAVATLNEMLFVAPGIDAVDALRGQRCALRDVGPSGLIARLWLDDHGLSDVEGVTASEAEFGRWGQWKAVANGDCQAAFITCLHAAAARAAGLRTLALEPYGFLGNVTLSLLQPVVEARPDDIADLVASAFEASRRFREDEPGTIEVMRRDTQPLLEIDDAALLATYRILRDELAPLPVPSCAAIANTHRMRLARSPELASFNPLLMWDLRFARAALGR